jgi:septal ring factor EnvC (AmiA/AmiB activator)
MDDGRMETNMTDDLRREMKAGFKEVSDQFQKVDDQFKNVDDQFKKVDDRFNKIDDQFKKIDDRFKKVDDQFADLRAEIRSEGETTRRHFDIVAEQFKNYVKVLADGTARNTEPGRVLSEGRTIRA